MAHAANDNLPVEQLIEQILRFNAAYPTATNAEAAEALQMTVRQVVEVVSACALQVIGAEHVR